MADFSFLSDTDDSAVDELISQAQELCVLEQVSKINSSGFTHSLLPTDLETRFHKLKSFPLSKSKTPTISRSNTDLNNISVKGRKYDDGSLSDPEKGENFSSKKQDPDGKMGYLKGEKEVFLDDPEGKVGLEKELKSGYVSSPPPSKSSMKEDISTPKKGNPDGKGGLKNNSLHGSDYSNSWVEDSIFSPSKHRSEKKMGMKSKSKSKSKSGSSNSSNSFIDSPSPPKKNGCFWCSLKRATKKQSKENLSPDWGNDNVDEFLSDLSTFSVKEQQKRLKKAMKEQEKMSKEAEKIVKWAKQASARMSFHGVDDELSDDEIFK